MASLRSRCGHYIFALWFLLSCGFFFLLLFFFPHLFSAVAEWMSTILLHNPWCGLSANLECRSEICCMQKMTQKSPSGHHRTTLSDWIFANKACSLSTIEKTVVKQQYLLHMSSQYGELRPTIGWDLLASLGHPKLGSVTARHSSSGR